MFFLTLTGLAKAGLTLVVARVIVGVNPGQLFQLALAFLDERGQHVSCAANFDLNGFVFLEEALGYPLLLQLSQLNHWKTLIA